MKTTSFLFVVFLLANSLFAQETCSRIFSSFETGLYGGINFSTLSSSGTSFILEGKTNLSANLNAKLSIGYSKSYLLDSYQVRTYSLTSIYNIQKYQTLSYDVNKTEYSIIPITLGLQYIFHHDIFSPYCLLEIGYNNYTTSFYTSNWTAGIYDSYDQIPSEYKSKPEGTAKSDSYRLGFGIGAKYQILPAINLDVRYLYQFNKVIINTQQLLVGFNYSY